MPQLDQEEVGFLEKLRKTGVLEDVNGNRLDTTQGVILVTCADGDQMADVFSRQSSMTARIHTLSLNGGGLLLPLCSPANRVVGTSLGKLVRIGDIYLEQIKVAQTLKNIQTIALHVHFPCGIARQCEIAPRQLIELLVEAKTRVKTEMTGETKVAAYLHIVWPDGRKRTYFVSREKWAMFRHNTPSTFAQ